MAKIIVADIGGTNSRFALFTSDPAGLRIESSLWLKTSEARSFAELLQHLGESNFPLPLAEADAVVFAIAGPVEGGVFCKPPSISWSVDLQNAEREFGLKNFSLINDFLAQAYSAVSPLGESAKSIIEGRRIPGAAIAVIGAGTGLGKAYLLPSGGARGGSSHYLGGASEGGHINFSAETKREFEFHEFVRSRYGGDYASNNDIVCGKGLALLEEFLTGRRLSPEEVASRLEEGSETLSYFSRFYARVVRNFALDILAFSGVYIAGGVAAKNPLILLNEEFRKTFRNSRVHSHILECMPVFLIDNQESGLWGAAYVAEQLLKG